MATFIHSKLTVVKLDTAAGVLTDISQYCNSCQLPQELEEVDVSAFGSTSRQFLAGFAGATFSIAGNWDRAHHTMMAAIYAAFRAGTLASVTFEYGPEGADVGDIKQTAEAVMLTYEKGSELEDPVTWSAEFRVSGIVTDTTY